jgi:hypothetical protein
MTSDGSAYSRFQRALATRNPLLIRTTAADLPRIDLGDALAIALVLLDVEPDRYGRAAARWHARFCLEVKGVDLAESGAVLALLGGLKTTSQVAAAQALLSVCETHGLQRAARAIDDWLEPRGH